MTRWGFPNGLSLFKIWRWLLVEGQRLFKSAEGRHFANPNPHHRKHHKQTLTPRRTKLKHQENTAWAKPAPSFVSELNIPHGSWKSKKNIDIAAMVPCSAWDKNPQAFDESSDTALVNKRCSARRREKELDKKLPEGKWGWGFQNGWRRHGKALMMNNDDEDDDDGDDEAEG